MKFGKKAPSAATLALATPQFRIRGNRTDIMFVVGAHHLGASGPAVASALQNAFVFSQTPQGSDYWDRILRRANENIPLGITSEGVEWLTYLFNRITGKQK